MISRYSISSLREKNTPTSTKMNKWCVLVVPAIFVFRLVVAGQIPVSVCGSSHSIVEENIVSMHTERDTTGEWVTTISAYHDSPNRTNLDVKRRVILCGGKQIVLLQATIRGSPQDSANDAANDLSLTFQERGGKNAEVTKDGLTIKRNNEINEIGYAGILTNRHLKNNELFEVMLDKGITKYISSVGIGVTPLSPADIQYLDWMKSGTIMLYSDNIYQNGSSVKSNYGPNLRTLKPGTRIGVMKLENGNLHFFVNGLDQGAAISGVTYPVYGVLDLYGDIVKATIVNAN